MPVLIARKVAGVFFAPVEMTPNQDAVNNRISDTLTSAGIPIVLVDRCIRKYPDRSRHDLVGIDNRRAGYRVTSHLLQAGCRRVAFAYRIGSAQRLKHEWPAIEMHSGRAAYQMIST